MSCPDPGIQPVASAGDALGLCVHKGCTTKADCTAPLICRYEEDAFGKVIGADLQCSYPTTAQPTGA
jgi:hypothetical protein